MTVLAEVKSLTIHELAELRGCILAVIDEKRWLLYENETITCSGGHVIAAISEEAADTNRLDFVSAVQKLLQQRLGITTETRQSQESKPKGSVDDR